LLRPSYCNQRTVELSQVDAGGGCQDAMRMRLSVLGPKQNHVIPAHLAAVSSGAAVIVRGRQTPAIPYREVAHSQREGVQGSRHCSQAA
jgi:hypothetical protein